MGVVTEVLAKVVGINWRTLTVLFVAFAGSSSRSGKTIHQNHELIEGQDEIFFLINNLEFCNIHIQDMVLQKKHFLFWLVNQFFAFSINTYVPFWLFGCVGLVMTKGYLAFNIMQYCKDMFTPRYQTCHATTLTCQNRAIIVNPDPNTVSIFINPCLWDYNPFNKAVF